MQNKIKVAMVTNDLNINGISTVIMNYCRNINLNMFEITIIAGAPVDNSYESECTALGIRIIMLPARKTSSMKYYLALKRTLSQNRFDIIHVHGNSATITVELLFAWLKGIKVRIAHSHNSTCTNIRVHKYLLPIFNKLYTHGFACSTIAGNWLFGDKKFYVIPNGFITERFKFDANARNKIRGELGVDEKFLIGHIGRFNDQKNQPFLLKIFEEVAKKDSDAWLILVGNGPDFEKVSMMIQQHPYKDRIIKYGETSETEKVYAAMDVFVFPSKYEGLGIVLLEAQINGLPCVSSDVIPNEAILGEGVTTLALSEGVKYWADIVASKKGCRNNQFYEENLVRIKEFNIRTNAQKINNLYKDFLVDQVDTIKGL